MCMFMWEMGLTFGAGCGTCDLLLCNVSRGGLNASALAWNEHGLIGIVKKVKKVKKVKLYNKYPQVRLNPPVALGGAHTVMMKVINS